MDKTLSVLVQRVKKKVLATIDTMDKQLHTLEGNMRWVHCSEWERRAVGPTGEGRRSWMSAG